MRAPAPFLTVLAAICIAAAGCSGGNAPGLPTTPGAPLGASANAVSAGTRAPAFAPDLGGKCRARHGCPARLVVPLTFDGHALATARFASCARVSGSAREYIPRNSRRFWLRSSVTIKSGCIPASKAQHLFIGVAEIAGKPGHAAGLTMDVNDGVTKASFVPLGRLEIVSGKTWTFSPLGFGVALHKSGRYIFYVVDSPLDGTTGNPSGNFVLLQPLSYDGTNFSVVPNACFQSDPQDAPAYAAPTSGPLTLSGNVTVTPTCVPSPLPSDAPLPQLYIVAVDVTNGGGGGDVVKHATHRATSNALTAPMDNSLGQPAVEIAGPVNVTDNPWSFAPASPGLTMTSGNSYAFFIAAALPPAPPPTQSYTEVIPLGFNGSTFSMPTISSCATLPSPAPYVAPTTAPLALSGSVSLTPTCVPGSSSSSSGSSATPQLYIVAVPGGCVSGGGSGSGSSSGGNGGDNGGNGGNGCCSGSSSGSSSSSGGCGGSGSGSGNSAKHANDGSGSGCAGGSGSGDSAVHANDGGSGNGCTIDGYAVAGPVNATDNPWNFAPISPAITLTGGAQYTFYVGVAQGDYGAGGGGGN